MAKWDIFGLGMLAWYFWTLREPFEHALGPDDLNHCVASGQRPLFDTPTGGAHMPRVFRETVERLWAQDPFDRPTAEEAVALLQEPELEAEIGRVTEGAEFRGGGSAAAVTELGDGSTAAPVVTEATEPMGLSSEWVAFKGGPVDLPPGQPGSTFETASDLSEPLLP
eukprot:CAMPEP_0185788996 /NCGR_PEP_ID=MMETSP1174-20130828/148794_1 /TAXON_ID=35687 /ORGANISM="Dictyocha speculum, Strain CCMP1381" /LENGTH=166 /DNA_ID=CAMNT_0028482927 /DNA_START=12 /DNA_END=512 /DNA_ORIENTATION=+